MANTPTKIISPLFRGSFCNLIKPKAIADGTPKYSMAIVLPKENKKTTEFLNKLKALFKIVLKEKLGKELPFERCKHFPIVDGDEHLNDDGEPIEQYVGCMIVNTSNSRQPGILIKDEDGSKRPIEDENEVYSGAWYYASLNPYAWSNEFGKGVSVSLNGVLKVKDGEKFAGSNFSEDDFDDVEDDEPSKKTSKPKKRSNDDEPPF